MIRIFRRLQDSQVRVQGFGDFAQDGLAFPAVGVDSFTITQDGEEIFETTLLSEVRDSTGAVIPGDNAAILQYLDDQLDPVQVSADYANTDIVTNINQATGFSDPFTLIPITASIIKPSPLYEQIDDFTIRALFFGESLFFANVHFRGATARLAPRIRLVANPNGVDNQGAIVTPSAFGPIGASGYIRNANSHTESSCHIAGEPRGHGQNAEFGLAVARDPGSPAGSFTLASNQTSHLSVCRVR